eukprot:scaffold1690_cov182-Amphora_coffeaeformis.AAC.76
MVGMQASLHTAREDSLRDLMKNDDDPMLSAGAFDDNAGGEIMMDDDFNPDALLMSPLFNDSTGKLDRSFTNENENEFGQFEEPHDTLLGRPDRVPVPPPSMEYSEPVPRMSRPAIVRESRNVKLPSISSMQAGMQAMGSGMMFSGLQQQQQQSSFAGYNSGMHVPSVVGGVDGNFHQVTDDISQFDQSATNFDQSQSDMHDYSAQSYRSPNHRRMPDRSISSDSSYRSECDSPAMGMSSSSMYQRSQHQMIPPTRSLPPKSQSYAGPSPGQLIGSSSNDLSVMRLQLQRMRDLEMRDAMQQNGQCRRTSDPNNPRGLNSQSMHLPVQRTASATSASLSRSMHYDSPQGRSTFHANGMTGSPSYSGSNVSIASDSRSFKPSFNPMERATNGSAGVNEAMEKLCESMKRSAMSRQMVKQYSSASRGVSRHGSGSLYAMRQASGRNSAMDDSSGRSAPIRRPSSTKHQLHHPIRGVYRNDSGASNGHRSFNFQMDGRNMGGL